MALRDKAWQTLLEWSERLSSHPSAFCQMLRTAAGAAHYTDTSVPKEINLSQLWAQMVDQNLGHLKDGNVPEKNTAAGRRFSLQTSHSPPSSYRLEIQNCDQRITLWETNVLTVKDSAMGCTWSTEEWEENQVLQNFSLESKFPMHAAKFFHLRLWKKEKCRRLLGCNIKLAVYGRKLKHTSFLYAEGSK